MQSHSSNQQNNLMEPQSIGSFDILQNWCHYNSIKTIYFKFNLINPLKKVRFYLSHNVFHWLVSMTWWGLKFQILKGVGFSSKLGPPTPHNANSLKAKILDLREFGIVKKSLYISNNLCPYYKSLAYQCRALKRLNLIDSVNVQDGKIIIIFRGRSYIINHETELLNMFPKIDFVDL